MSLEFKNIITLTQVSDGAQGATGSPGASLEIRYKLDTVTPATPENPASEGWSKEMLSPTSDKNVYMTQKMSNADDWSTPIQISARNGQDGQDGQDGKDGTTPTIEIENGYWIVNGTATGVKAEGADGQNGQDGQDGHTPQVEVGENGNWFIDGVDSGTPAQGETGKQGPQGPQGPQGEPGEDGTDGINGSEIEYVYYQSKEPLTNSSPRPGRDNDGNLTGGWTESPKGVDNENQYEYVSVRTKPAGAEDWGSYSDPVIWSKWGEKGQDGDGIKYKYYRSEQEEENLLYDDSDPNWTEEPKGVSENYPYEYVVQLTITKNSTTTTTTAGPVALWAKFGVDGKGYYIETNTGRVCGIITSGTLETNPRQLEISVYKTLTSKEVGQEEINANNYEFGYINNAGDFISLKESDYLSIGEELENVGGETVISKPYTLIYKIQDAANKELNLNQTLVFRFLKDNLPVATKAIPFEYGTSQDLAQFNVNAFDINAAVQGNYLSFDEKGLTLTVKTGEKDNGLRINKLTSRIVEDKTENIIENVFYANEKGDLCITGNVYAKDGSFSGEINAQSGSIGGFKIHPQGYSKTRDKEPKEGKAYYVFEEGVYKPATPITFENETYYEFHKEPVLSSEDDTVQLFGETGKIIAKDIVLGEKATIQSQIKLGNAYICNPSSHDGVVIKAGTTGLENSGIIIKDDGTANFGDININGNESSIIGRTWELKSGSASFENVNVSGSIETSVFKTNSTQAAGGTMVFRPSYKVIEEKDSLKTLSIEKEDQFDLKDHDLWVVDNTGLYYAAKVKEHDTNTNEIKLEYYSKSPYKKEGNQPKIKLVIDLGSTNDAIIGINSGNSTIGNLIYPCGLTITKFNAEKPSLFLGDLSQLSWSNNGFKFSGHGLYADNVYLNGSLTTKSNNNTYAGVNTISGVSATIFPYNPIDLKEEDWEENKYYIKVAENKYEKASANFDSQQQYYELDDTNVIFWAGAQGTSDSAIQNAPFQVTEKGSVYASRIKLVKSLITEGEIHGAKIYAVDLYGEGEKGALNIYDTAGGVIFKTQVDGADDEETFRITSKGMQIGTLVADQEGFVSINSDGVKFIGDVLRTSNNTNYLALTTSPSGTPMLQHVSNQGNCGLYFEANQTSFKLEGKEISKWTESGTSMYGNVEIACDGITMEYRKVNNGYDLYIKA